jgi:hypothetical protein
LYSSSRADMAIGDGGRPGGRTMWNSAP